MDDFPFGTTLTNNNNELVETNFQILLLNIHRVSFKLKTCEQIGRNYCYHFFDIY